MGEKGLELIERLPQGYHIDPPGKDGSPVPGVAIPDGRPGYRITWDQTHGTWRPPGFEPSAGDNDHVFNPTTGQNGVWDGDKQQWIDTQTGKPLTYEQ